LWVSNGVALCTASNDQFEPHAVEDGTGGIIAAWRDARGLDVDVYSQRINGSGVVQWAAGGVALCVDTGDQVLPRVVADGAGGAIAGWVDYRNAVTGDIFAQSINASGAVQWAINGVKICTDDGSQNYPWLSADGSGGAIVGWSDERGATSFDIYAQRVNAAGVTQWTSDGVLVCDADWEQLLTRVVPSGTSDAILTWIDFRSVQDYDVYAQYITADGIPPTAVRPATLPSLVVGKAYPNPFSSEAMLEIATDSESNITIELFDAHGRRVHTQHLVGLNGRRVVSLPARAASGHPLASGVYFCRVATSGESATRKLVIVR
jgi:hypothetical protein